ncbi:Tripartite motif-containing protein 43 [Manis javanica]|nr:Tripartite motif-containing protein 43 [Manis javanica]
MLCNTWERARSCSKPEAFGPAWPPEAESVTMSAFEALENGDFLLTLISTDLLGLLYLPDLPEKSSHPYRHASEDLCNVVVWKTWPTHLLLRNMDSDLAQAFHKEVTCLFCLHYLTDPVTLDCGHSFCRPCVCLFWEAAEVPATCPLCGQPSQLTHYNTNFLLKNLVSTARKASVRQFLSSEDQKCGPHKEAKQVFCEEDRSLLCRHCSQSQEHKAHRHCSTEGAAEEYREKLSKQMRSVWQKIEDIERNLAKDGRISIYWMMYVTHHKDMTRAVYRPLHPILLEEEHQHLELLKEEGQKGFAQLEKIRCQNLDRKRHLRMVYRELRKMCQKPDVELLLELRDMLKWSEQAIQGHIPRRLRPELRARPVTGLMDRLNHFRDVLQCNQPVDRPPCPLQSLHVEEVFSTVMRPLVVEQIMQWKFPLITQ